AEDRRVGADADAEREQRGEGEAASAAERAQREADVLGEAVQPGQAALIVPLLDRALGTAEVEQRGTVGLGGGEAAAAMSLLEHCEVEGELLLRRFPLAVAVAERPEQPGDELAQVHQREVSGWPSRRPITAAMRFHSAASRSSCRRPARVRL